MIIDVRQKASYVQVSYTDDKGGIGLAEIPLPETGYQNWEICDENDPNKHPTIKNYNGSCVKKMPGKRFYDLNVHEFLQVGAPEEYRNLIHTLNKPNFFSVDIETEITVDAMPDAETAPNKILSISITASNFATVILSLKEVDMDAVMNIVHDELKAYTRKHTFNARHIVFNNEREMLEFFLLKVKDTFHVHGGWNYHSYDWLYIKNRCKKLGINPNISSPVNELDNEGFPVHRFVIDYMNVYKDSNPSRDLTSMSLNAVSEYELGMHKLSYEKTLKELYVDDYVRFMAYAIIDTILVQLIHHKTNKLDLLYNMAYYTKISVKHADKNISLTDSLIFKELWNRGEVFADKRGDFEKTEYPGAFVKSPVVNECDFPACWDAKSLYPSSGLTMHISPESYMGKAQEKDVKRLREAGYVVTHRLSIYKKDKTYLFPKMWGDLRVERDVYKNCMFQIWQQLEGKIEAEAKRRGIALKDEH